MWSGQLPLKGLVLELVDNPAYCLRQYKLNYGWLSAEELPN